MTPEPITQPVAPVGTATKVIGVKIPAARVEEILRNGYPARGHLQVCGGIPPDARLEQAQMIVDAKGAAVLALYFLCAGDGYEERMPRLEHGSERRRAERRRKPA